MQLLERAAHLAALADYAADAQRGDGRVVLIGGEAGVGKTALVDELRGQLDGVPWYWGACHGSFVPRPLGPVQDVAGQLGGELAVACAGEADRSTIFRALLDQLVRTDHLAVLCLEDLHWADEATVDLLGFLAPRLRNTHVLLLLTYRDDGLGAADPLRTTLGEIGATSTCRRIDLPPLTRGTVTRLAQQHDIAPDRLFALTSGNPFLVTEVLESGARDVPPSIRDAALARAARLSGPARAALDAAAVIGNRIDVDVLLQVAECDLQTLDECLTTGAIRSDANGFRFRHEIARRAIEAALPAHRRLDLHRRILAALATVSAPDPARQSHHADAAGDARMVLHYAPIAARKAAGLGAHREALRQYERALRYAEDTTTRAGLLTSAGTEYALTDQWQDAARVQQEALELWQQLGDRQRQGEVLWQLGRTMWRICRGDEACEMAERAVRVLEQLPPSPALGWACSVLAGFRGATGAADADALLARAEEIAELTGDQALLANVVDSIGCTKDGPDAEPDLRRALAIALSAGDDAEAGRAFVNLQCVLANSYRLAESEQVFRDGMDYCADHDIHTYEHCLRGGQGGVLERLGRWDEADTMLSFDLEERALSPVNRISKLVVKGVIDARRGRSGAEAALDEALRYAEAGVEPAYVLEVAVARIEAAWLAGDAAGMRREAERGLPVVDLHDDWWQGNFQCWLRRCGIAAPAFGRLPSPYALASAGNWRAAADAWHALEVPYEEGLALLDSGDADAMTRAVRIFDRLGATATVARAQATMRQRGIAAVPRGARPDTRNNRFGLTRREDQVLELVCDGLTNAEIARRLCLARKTVDNHVSAVLAKLGVDSRRAAAQRVHAAN